MLKWLHQKAYCLLYLHGGIHVTRHTVGMFLCSTPGKYITLLPSKNKTFVKHLYNVGRWADVVQMLCKCFIFAGLTRERQVFTCSLLIVIATKENIIWFYFPTDFLGIVEYSTPVLTHYMIDFPKCKRRGRSLLLTSWYGIMPGWL